MSKLIDADRLHGVVFQRNCRGCYSDGTIYCEEECPVRRILWLIDEAKPVDIEGVIEERERREKERNAQPNLG